MTQTASHNEPRQRASTHLFPFHLSHDTETFLPAPTEA